MPMDSTRPMSYLSTVRREASGYGSASSRVRARDGSTLQGGSVMGEFAIQEFRGRLIGPSDKDYDEARALYNGMIDKRPKVIARCTDAADVIAAVNSARANKPPLPIPGGAHNGPGFGGGDRGLVIHVSEMLGV